MVLAVVAAVVVVAAAAAVVLVAAAAQPIQHQARHTVQVIPLHLDICLNNYKNTILASYELSHVRYKHKKIFLCMDDSFLFCE